MIDKFFRYILFLISTLIIISIFYRLYTFGKFLEFSSHLYYLKYYLFSISVFLFSYLSKYLKKKLFISICVITTSILTTLYFFESFFYISEILKRGEDKRSIIKVYEDQKKIDDNVIITLPPTSFINKHYDLLPLSHKSNTLIIDCNELGYYAMNQSDKNGFNNDNSVWTKDVDYLIIGDSFTYGHCVLRKNNIASIISEQTGKNIINISMPGNGLLLNYATFREYFSKKKIKNIIWFINDNDFENLNYELNDRNLIKYLHEENFFQDLKNKNKEINFIINDLFKKRFTRIKIIEFFLLKKTRFFITYRLKLLRNASFDKIDYSKKLQNSTDMIFKKLIKEVDSKTKIFMVYVPVKNKFLEKNYNSNFKNISKKIAYKHNFIFIDLDNIIINYENPLNLFSKYFPHYSEKGYKILSTYISNELKKH
tara:strand:- start:17255 stop:18532 length:1278 start_codon:yes stop_codon:yes gene_type:complete